MSQRFQDGSIQLTYNGFERQFASLARKEEKKGASGFIRLIIRYLTKGVMGQHNKQMVRS